MRSSVVYLRRVRRAQSSTHREVGLVELAWGTSFRTKRARARIERFGVRNNWARWRGGERYRHVRQGLR